MQESGLTREYRENKEVRIITRACATPIVFLRPEDVSDEWLTIHSKSLGVTKLATFFLWRDGWGIMGTRQ